ncbi:unnamed protein product [Litomosoides sigmodontis]|uniref:Uncharacterized protein n=1 Tax=Litomosoides sigmodontis TaxID=42156 RepID=A0A3P6U1Q5_LITSI|nr:unnamed protein product [Litomosoides sigmodontis]
MLHFLSKHTRRPARVIHLPLHEISLRILKQMYLWFTTTIPMTTTFITSITGGITVATVLLSCAVKSKRLHEPEQLPEFVDANAKEADTYYGMRSTVAFPVKGSKIKRKDDLKVPEDAEGTEPNIGTKQRDMQNRGMRSGNTQAQESKPAFNRSKDGFMF